MMLTTSYKLLPNDYNQYPRVPFLQPRMTLCRLVQERKLCFAANPVFGCSARRGNDVPLGCVSASSASRGEYEMGIGDDLSKEPVWLSWIKDLIGGMKSFFSFFTDQPRQLRYIEWPTFSSTLKTASLTLIIVALLIVALATVDSGLSYLLALFLRRKP